MWLCLGVMVMNPSLITSNNLSHSPELIRFTYTEKLLCRCESFTLVLRLPTFSMPSASHLAFIQFLMQDTEGTFSGDLQHCNQLFLAHSRIFGNVFHLHFTFYILEPSPQPICWKQKCILFKQFLTVGACLLVFVFFHDEL